MAFTDSKWDGAASNYKDTDAYCAACLIDMNPAGKDKAQALCKLPVKTPEGDYNTNAMSSAAGVLNGGMGGLKDVPASEKAKAISKLRSLYAQNGVKRADMPKALQ